MRKALNSKSDTETGDLDQGTNQVIWDKSVQYNPLELFSFSSVKTEIGMGDDDDWDSYNNIDKKATRQVSHVFPYMRVLCGAKKREHWEQNKHAWGRCYKRGISEGIC